MEKQIVQFNILPKYANVAAQVYEALGTQVVYKEGVDPIGLGIGVIGHDVVIHMEQIAPVMWLVLNNVNITLLLENPEYAKLVGMSSSDIAALQASGRLAGQLAAPMMFELDSLLGNDALVANEVNSTPGVVGYASAILSGILSAAPAEWSNGTKDLDLVMWSYLKSIMPQGKSQVVLLTGSTVYEQGYWASYEAFAQQGAAQGVECLVATPDTLATLLPEGLGKVGVVYNLAVNPMSANWNAVIGNFLDAGAVVTHAFPAASMRVATTLFQSKTYRALVVAQLAEHGFSSSDLDAAAKHFPNSDVFFLGQVDVAGVGTFEIRTSGLLTDSYITSHWFKFSFNGGSKPPGEADFPIAINGAALSPNEKKVLVAILNGSFDAETHKLPSGEHAAGLHALGCYISSQSSDTWSCLAQEIIAHHQIPGQVPSLTGDGKLSQHLLNPMGMLRFYLWGCGGAVVSGQELFMRNHPPVRATAQGGVAVPVQVV